MQKVQIISFALGLLGRKPIITLDNQNDITAAAEQAFDFLVPVILSKGQWRFATKIIQVSELEVDPIITYWKYSYQLPSDYLKMIRQYPHNYDFEMYDDLKMYSNVGGPLYIEYIFQPSISQFPPYFNEYLAYAIAENLALSNAHSVTFASKLAQDKGVIMAQALASDAQNRPQTPLMSQPIITNRAVTSYPYGQY